MTEAAEQVTRSEVLKRAYGNRALRHALGVVQNAIGSKLTTMGMTGLAVTIPTFVGTALTAARVSPGLTEIVQEIFGGALEAIQFVHFAETDGAAIRAEFRGHLEERIEALEFRAEFEKAVELLSSKYRSDLIARLESMTPEQRTLFNGYKRHLTSVRWIETVLGETSNWVTPSERVSHMMRHLTTLYSKPPTTTQVVESGIEKAVKTVRTTVKAGMDALETLLGDDATAQRSEEERRAFLAERRARRGAP